MGWRLAADAVLLAHLAFVLFVAFGALVVARWRWTAWLHLPALAWGVFVELTGRLCPLTTLENLLRRRAGEAGYASGFIERYVLPVVYPEGLDQDLQLALGLGALALNALLYATVVRSRWRARRLGCP